MCWTRFKTRFFAVRVPQGGSTRQQNNARLLTGGRRAARAESFDYYSVAGDPARGGTMRRRAGRARADGGAAPSPGASVPRAGAGQIGTEAWRCSRQRLTINNQLPGLGAREDARPTHSITDFVQCTMRNTPHTTEERTESADGSHGPTSRPAR
jgi:hypothetical protein